MRCTTQARCHTMKLVVGFLLFALSPPLILLSEQPESP